MCIRQCLMLGVLLGGSHSSPSASHQGVERGRRQPFFARINGWSRNLTKSIVTPVISPDVHELLVCRMRKEYICPSWAQHILCNVIAGVILKWFLRPQVHVYRGECCVFWVDYHSKRERVAELHHHCDESARKNTEDSLFTGCVISLFEQRIGISQ